MKSLPERTHPRAAVSPEHRNEEPRALPEAWAVSAMSPHHEEPARHEQTETIVNRLMRTSDVLRQSHDPELAAIGDRCCQLGARLVAEEASMLTVTTFRDTRDVIPRAKQLHVHQLCEMLAPALPTIRQDLTDTTAKQIRVLEDALNAILNQTTPSQWLRRHRWYRELEKIAWMNSDQPSHIISKLLDDKTAEIADNIVRRAKTQLPCWSPAIYAPRTVRGIEGVVAVSCLVLDYDDGTDPDEALLPWEGNTALLHTSWSHTANHPRFRLILPLREPVAAAEWPGVWRWAQSQSNGEIDIACKDPSRLYLLPAKPRKNSHYMRRVLNIKGPLLSPGTLQPEPPRPLRIAPSPVQSRARQMLKTSQDARERAARWLGATVRSGRAEHITCPQCRRPSVWFWLSPGPMLTATCKHKISCGWWGHLDTLLEARGRDVG